MSVSIYMKGDYEKLYALKAVKNKANSKPICYRSVFSVRSPKDCVLLWSPYGQRAASKRKKDFEKTKPIFRPVVG